MFGNNNIESFKGAAPTYVGKGMCIEGKIWGKRPIWIDGEVKGTIDIGSEVIIGESAKVDATIRASTIKINGFVEGELYASAKIEIMSKGRVHGNVTNLAGCLIIHDGGIVEGLCSIANKEKMKSLLPQEFPKLLPEQSTAPPEVIHTPENIKESLSISAETSA
ncbi:MAG: polymer-forming cytoskeletal protein [SAR324 cluster bacterium]|nr:polymer-forming cytoskeletal protein [SAR324 cluster bacterium]